MNRHQHGADSETAAASFLEAKGWRLLSRNFKLEDAEIDLVLANPEGLLFVEVKYRRNESFASILEQIRPQQCLRIRRAAQVYMLKNNIDEHTTRIRFDVIAMVGEPPAMHWLKDAF